MRRKLSKQVEAGRIQEGKLASETRDGRNGAFLIQLRSGVVAAVIISDGAGWEHDNLPGEPWEHVSVSFRDRCPTWDEMDEVRHIFWSPEETVIQFHPPNKIKVNVHSYCLHLWRPTQSKIPLPPVITV